MYQVPLAEAVKKAYPNISVGAVGFITSAEQANGILEAGKADVIFIAKELIRTPHFPLLAAQQLGVAVKPANQYERGWMALITPKKI